MALPSGRKRRLLPACFFYTSVTIILALSSSLIEKYTKNEYLTDSHSSGRRLLELANCTPRSLDEFPGNFMSEEQRKSGGVVVHFIISFYVFAALAIVCDDYFVPSLEVLCDVFSMKPDVAGATFMAAGSSAPELFTSVIGVFFTKSDVGVGTIVGSAVFNVLFIVALCGLFGGMVIYLSWWPLFRDCLFYALSVAALIAMIYDEQIHWYEATIMLGMYISYIVLMYFNEGLSSYFIRKVSEWKARGQTQEKEPLVKNIENGNGKYDALKEPEGKAAAKEKSEEFESPLSWPETCGRRMFWLLMLPISLLFFISIPDCRRPGCWRLLFPITFVMSVAWIAMLSYVLVWMITIIGDTLGIPDTVMGLTVLAAGTSIPDAMAGLIVAREGEGDMALSNSIGSNVFDILIGLGLPWFLQTAVLSPASVVTIKSAGLTFSSISLLGTVLFLLLAITCSNWRLDKRLGAICLLVYVIFITFACLYELNVFGYLNPPPCPRI